MNLWDAVILGIVEGLTEFVPVSSTGHLILANAWLGLDATADQKAAVDAFDIVIQSGAWLACVLYYAGYLRQRVSGVFSRDAEQRALGMKLLVNLAVAFVPVVLIGLSFRSAIKASLFGAAPVAIALAIGGVLMIASDRWLMNRAHTDSVDAISTKQAFIVGLCQCASLIPGTSRSMSTIIGGMMCGLNTRVAADFSFLLAVPVLGGATVYELAREWQVMSEHVGAGAMAIGTITSFVVGWLSIAGFLGLLAKRGLAPFGWYRVALALVVWQGLT